MRTSGSGGGFTQTQGDVRYTKIEELVDHANALLGANLVGWRPPSGTGDGRTLAAMLLGQYADPKDYGAYGGVKVTTGTVTAGDLSHITLASVTGLTKGNDLMIETLGTAGGKHYSEIQSISGPIVTLVTPVVSAGTGVIVTVHDREAIQRAHDYLQTVGGGILRLDATHVIARTPVSIKSNVTVIGTPRGVLRHHQGAGAGGVGAFSLVDVTNTAASGVATNIRFEGVTFDGNRPNISVYQEHLHCLRLYDAEDVVINKCVFKNLVGDGLYVARPAGAAGSFVGSHRIKAIHNTFLANNDNRNGITLTCAREVTLRGNYFFKQTRTDMPGDIDLEPDADDFISDVLITENHFDHSVGTPPAGAVINVGVSGAGTGRSIDRVVVDSNVLRGPNALQGIAVNLQTASGTMGDVTVSNNIITGGTQGILVIGPIAPQVKNNVIKTPTTGGIVISALSAPDVIGNLVRGAGTVGIEQNATTAGACRIINNHLIDCGANASWHSGILIRSNHNDVIGNKIEASAAQTAVGVYIVTGYQNVIDANRISGMTGFNIEVDTTEPQIFGDKNVLGQSVSNFVAGTYPPTTRTWAGGTRIYNLASSAKLAPAYYECVVGGTAGTWVSIPRSRTISADRGDASVTLTTADDSVQRFATTLTANRTVTLPSTGAYNGMVIEVVRTGLGAFTLDVGGLKTIPSATAAKVEVTHDGTAWRLTGYGTL